MCPALTVQDTGNTRISETQPGMKNKLVDILEDGGYREIRGKWSGDTGQNY